MSDTEEKHATLAEIAGVEQSRPQPNDVISRRRMLSDNMGAVAALAAGLVAAGLPGRARAQMNGGGNGMGGGGKKCFLRGTPIKTIDGERSVEDLAIGDLLVTAAAEIRPIQWIGSWRYRRSNLGQPWKKHERPVRIARSALASDVPHTDLYVTAGHALFVDGVLVPAGSLVNGTTIAFYAAEELDQLEYFHIKLSTHDVIIAAGAPCETLLQMPETANGHDGERVGRREVHCAPILCNGTRSRLLSRARSAMTPWLGAQKLDRIRARLQEHARAVA